MPHRQFVDAAGALWAVWDVRPIPVTDPVQPGPLRWHADRVGSAAGLDPVLSSGWLCFEREGEKRRLAPIPTGWEEMAPHELVTLCQTAASVRRRGTPGTAA